MELKEFKKLVAYAKKSGVRSFAIGDCQVSFRDELPLTQTRKLKSVATTPQNAERVIPAPDPGPTLEQINQYIYGADESA